MWSSNLFLSGTDADIKKLFQYLSMQFRNLARKFLQPKHNQFQSTKQMTGFVGVLSLLASLAVIQVC